ncbi:MAG: hypothetical protein U1E98_01720 [Moraxella osloensis]
MDDDAVIVMHNPDDALTLPRRSRMVRFANDLGDWWRESFPTSPAV